MIEGVPIRDKQIQEGLDYLREVYGEEAVDKAIDFTSRLQVETPAWLYWMGFGGTGDRFAAGSNFNPLGAARNNEEIAADAGLVHKLTHSAPTVGAHVLWQLTTDGKEGNHQAAEKFNQLLVSEGLKLGSISPTYFIGECGDGSLTSQDGKIVDNYMGQTVFAADVANKLGQHLVTLWFPDGTNLPGQRALQDKFSLLRQGIEESVFWIPTKDRKSTKILVEYKVFEPGTYSTTVPDALTATLLAQAISRGGAIGGVLVDMGHHHHGTNIEQIVGTLIKTGMPGGFHFNGRYAADDDHPVEPTPTIARIFHELIYGNVVYNEDEGRNWVLALDQMPRAEERIPAALKSIEALKISIARAALYDDDSVSAAQRARDLIGANRRHEHSLLLADTRPIMWDSYRKMGLHPDPIRAYFESGYQGKIMQERSTPLRR